MNTLAKRLLLAVSLTASPLVAAAQTAPTAQIAAPQTVRGVDLSDGAGDKSMFSRDRNIAVRERARPEYQALGLSNGGFSSFPKVEGGLEYNDNIFAASTGRTSDWIWRVKPQFYTQSNWSQHLLDFYGSATFNRYFSNTTENTTDWDIGADGRLDVNRATNVGAGAEFSRFTEPRTSSGAPIAAAHPVQYTVGQSYLDGSHVFNRLKLSARGDWKKFDYISVPSILGGLIGENNRDRTYTDAVGRADYAISPDTAVFIEASGNWRDYRKPGTLLNPARDSQGYQVLGGANFDLTSLLRGEIGVGYIHQDYKSALYGDTGGFGARATVEWFPSQITTVTATASRSIEDSAIVGSGGYLTTNGGLQVDHEFLRNLIVSANASYGNDSYNGVDRTDRRYGAGLSATYLLTRRIGLNTGYTYFKQNSSGAQGGQDFRVNRFTVGLVLQY